MRLGDKLAAAAINEALPIGEAWELLSAAAEVVQRLEDSLVLRCDGSGTFPAMNAGCYYNGQRFALVPIPEEWTLPQRQEVGE